MSRQYQKIVWKTKTNRMKVFFFSFYNTNEKDLCDNLTFTSGLYIVESTTLIGENFVFSFEIFIVMFMPLFDKFSNSGRRGTHLEVQACMD